MIWKELRQNDEIFGHIGSIWRHEQSLPSWFVSSSSIWTSTEDDFRAFAADCQEIHGLFDGERLTACIYVEKQQDARVMAIHLSVLGAIDTDVLTTQLTKLRNAVLHRGVKYIRGWTLRRNFALVRIMAACGFRKTNFIMDHGTARGRVLRWELMEVSAA